MGCIPGTPGTFSGHEEWVVYLEHLEHFQDLKNGSGTHFLGPENVPCDEY